MLIWTAVVLAWSAVVYASSSIKGTVIDHDNRPVTGARVVLMGTTVSSTTGSSGEFSMNRPVPVRLHRSARSTRSAWMDSKVYTPAGRRLPLMEHGGGSVRDDSQVRTMARVPERGSAFPGRILLLDTRNSRNVPKNGGNIRYSAGRMMQAADTFDTLEISHAGYLTKRIVLPSSAEHMTTALWKREMRLSNEMPGWNDVPDGFAMYDTFNLYDLINGGATVYIERSMVDGIRQWLKGADIRECEIYVMDFGDSSKAGAMFAYQKKEAVFSTIPVPGFDAENAVGDEFIGGGIFYGHISRFYIEFSLRGFDDRNELQTRASAFFTAYQSKIAH